MRKSPPSEAVRAPARHSPLSPGNWRRSLPSPLSLSPPPLHSPLSTLRKHTRTNGHANLLLSPLSSIPSPPSALHPPPVRLFAGPHRRPSPRRRRIRRSRQPTAVRVGFGCSTTGRSAARRRSWAGSGLASGNLQQYHPRNPPHMRRWRIHESRKKEFKRWMQGVWGSQIRETGGNTCAPAGVMCWPWWRTCWHMRHLRCSGESGVCKF